MMNRLICGCLRDRQALKHRRHTPEEAHGGVAHLSDDDEMAVVELPPLPTATVVRPPASAVAAVSKSKPAPVPVASTSKPAAAGEEDLLTGLRPSPPPVAATAPPQQPASLQQQQHKSTPTKAGPVPTSAAPSPRSPAAPASPAPPSPAPSPRSPGPEEAASPLRLPSRTVHASPTPAPAPGVLSPATSISTIKPPSATNANWAEAWAPMVRERQQAYTQEKAKQEIVAALGKGIAALKHDRKGHARVRELYTPDGGQSFSWRSPHKEKAGHGRGKSSAGAGGGGGAGMFERGRAVYAFHEILEVRRGTVPDPSTGGKESGTETLRASCPKSDLYKSFSLILKDRTVDFTCHSIEQMTYLLKGITTLMAEQKRALLKARAAAAAAEAPASPGRTTAAY